MVANLLFSFKGRINRKKYWIGMIPVAITTTILYYLLEIEEINYLVYFILQLLMIWWNSAIHIKRWHDRNKSGWFYFVFIIPYVGQAWTLIECGFLKGSDGPNRFGEDPTIKFRKNDFNNDNNSDSPNENFIDLFSMLSILCKSDGYVSSEEITVIEDFMINILTLSSNDRKRAINIFNNAKNNSTPFEVFAKRFYEINKFNEGILKGVFELLLAVSYADNNLSSEEVILLSEVISIFKLEESAYTDFNYGDNGENQNDFYDNIDIEQNYKDILGVNDCIDFTCIKLRYRELVKQYHPDKVSHLGQKIKDIAAKEMLKINEAYEYFKKMNSR